jgi:hypothetical protein
VKTRWLDDDYTKAAVTKGWFRRRVAIVHKVAGYWYYAGTDVRVGYDVEDALQRARWTANAQRDKNMRELKACIEEEHWIPIPTLPKAKLLKG